MLPPNYLSALGQIESSNNYGELGPVTKSGDRAYGRYQVMGNNIGPWTKQHLGRQMTPEEFLASPQAQDAVAQGQFGHYVGKYGPEGAARAWFAGEGGMNNMGAKDQLGTSVQNYGQRFMGALGQDPQALAFNGEPAPMSSAFDSVKQQPQQDQAPMAQAMSKPPQDNVNAVANGMERAAAWLGSVNHPETLKALSSMDARDQQNLPQWGVIGQDKYGKPAYGWINRSKQSITPASGVAQAGQNIENDPAEVNMANNIRFGKVQPPRGAANSALWNPRLELADKLDREAGGPGLDMSKWETRFRTAQDFGSGGKAGTMIGKMNTLDRHLEKYSGSVEALDNGEWPSVNATKDLIANNTSFDEPRRLALRSLAADRKAVIDEMGNAYKAGVLSDKEVRDWTALMSTTDSKDGMHRTAAEFLDLINGKRASLYDQFKNNIGTDFKDNWSDEHARIDKVIHDRSAGVKSDQVGSPQAPAKRSRIISVENP